MRRGRPAGGGWAEAGFGADYFDALLITAKRHRRLFSDSEIDELSSLVADMKREPELASDLAEWLHGASRVAIKAVEEKQAKVGEP